MLGWYVARCTIGDPSAVRDRLLERAREQGLQDQILEAIVPTEHLTEIRGERKLYSGYLIIRMVLNDVTAKCARETPGMGGFLTTTPLSEDDIARLPASKDPPSGCSPIRIRFDR